jgi:hypothetical protein
MAFIHCHGERCHWEQDDFWSWNYNPIQTFFSYVKDMKLWYPHMLEFDRHTMPPTGKIHSYAFVRRLFRKMLVKFGRMEWWTWEAYKKAKAAGEVCCPQCGKRDLCID